MSGRVHRRWERTNRVLLRRTHAPDHHSSWTPCGHPGGPPGPAAGRKEAYGEDEHSCPFSGQLDCASLHRRPGGTTQRTRRRRIATTRRAGRGKGPSLHERALRQSDQAARFAKVARRRRRDDRGSSHESWGITATHQSPATIELSGTGPYGDLARAGATRLRRGQVVHFQVTPNGLAIGIDDGSPIGREPANKAKPPAVMGLDRSRSEGGRRFILVGDSDPYACPIVGKSQRERRVRMAHAVTDEFRHQQERGFLCVDQSPIAEGAAHQLSRYCGACRDRRKTGLDR